MSRRRRCAREKAVQSRVARAKVLRRRARGAGSRRVTAAIAAAVTLTGVGASTAAATTSADGAKTLTNAGRSAGASLSSCSDPQIPASDPAFLTDVGGSLFFSADDGLHGSELWKSNGTKAGTALVKDIRPGNDHYFRAPSDLTDVGGTLFFNADDGTHGPELWKSDGTKAGTVMVKDIQPRLRLLRLRPVGPDRCGRDGVLQRRRRHPRL